MVFNIIGVYWFFNLKSSCSKYNGEGLDYCGFSRDVDWDGVVELGKILYFNDLIVVDKVNLVIWLCWVGLDWIVDEIVL